MSIQRLLRHLRNSFLNLGKTLTRSLSNFIQRGLHSLFQISRQRQAGFVLPTVTMVILVVSLLSLAMLLRSTDRAKNAHNFRVNEATLNATAPALDRAKAKIAAIFEDPNIPRGTPSDTAFMGAFGGLGSGIENYTFGDEVPLKLVFDIDGDNNTGEEDSGAAKNTKNDETVNTAWKFPVDTDNNGKFDSYTLYTILFRNPTTSGGEFTRARNPLEARNLPMEGTSGSACANNTGGGASLVGDSDWFQLPNEQKLKKAFFVYAATVPIGPNASGALPTGLDANQYELYPGGTQGFSALEYQQDWSRIPLANNAVVYQDDLLTFAGSNQFFNGRIITNANLMVGKGKNVRSFTTKFFLVSSKSSCFYDPESSKIIVGGNVGNNRYDDFAFANGTVHVDELHLFQGEGNDPTRNANFGRVGSVTTTTVSAKQSLYNNNAYNQRISYLVNAAFWLGTGAYPNELLAGRPPANVSEQEAKDYYTKYFRQLTRQVPYIEVEPGNNALFIPTITTGTGIAANGFLVSVDSEAKAKDFFKLSHASETADKTGLDPLRPPHQWMFPVDPNNNATTYMQSKTSSANKLELELTRIPATNPEELDGKEERIGDRVLVGNNLPETIYIDDSSIEAESRLLSGIQTQQEVTGVKWRQSGSAADSTVDRTRQSQVVPLPDLGDLSRDGQWEIDAATAPKDKFDNVGGLRIVTGTGIYLPGANATKTSPPLDETGDDKNEKNIIIWPDYYPVAQKHPEVVFDQDNNPTTEPVSVDSAANTTRPYLRMRATVVYHHTEPSKPFAENGYKDGDQTHQRPIACIANYYDPTDTNSDTTNSNNGKVYSWRNTSEGTYTNMLKYQAALRYPEVIYDDSTADLVGDRRVNPLLASALNRGSVADRTIAEQSAVEAAICALDILNGSATASTAIDDNAIKEITFLDARQIKANDVHSLQVTGGASGTYTLANRMPTPAFEVGDLVTIEEYQRTPTTTPPVDKNIPKIVRGQITAISGDNITVSTTTNGSVYAASDPSISSDGTGWITESLSSRYDLPIEERYPLEIRATQIDLEKLKQKTIGTSTDPQEYLIPNSGIIYATREDALPDQTVWVEDGRTTFKRTGDAAPDLPQSSTDFKLDPTRRPNAILLINGEKLNRGTTNDYRPEEKGFILATDLPVYIQGDFNRHLSGTDEVEEFTQKLNKTTYANFYTRSTLDSKFACRKGQPGCNGDGDTWRSATVFADALTLLSDDFQFGYRSDGNYDLNNNQGDARSIAKRRRNGFYTNDFAASRNFTDAEYKAKGPGDTPSSYFTNFVTPVQRRVNFPEYVMEICEKLPISECEPDDWHIIGYDADKSGTVDTASINELGGLKLDLDSSGDPTFSIAASTTVDEANFGISLNNNGTLESITIDPSNPSTLPDENQLGIDLNNDGLINGSVAENEIKVKASELPFLDRYLGITTKKVNLQSGTTANPPTDATLVKFPRRIAFLRDGDNELVFGPNNTPIALGINGSGEVGYYSYGALTSAVVPGKYGTAIAALALTPTFELTAANVTDGVPQAVANTLWFRTTATPTNPIDTSGWRYHSQRYLAYWNDLTTDPTVQPLLIPILQIHATDSSPGATTGDAGRPMEVNGSIAVPNGTFTIDRNSNKYSRDTDWVQHAKTGGTTFNLVFVSGDTAGRPDELNRSLGNFPRFLEDWNGVNVNITGSFIQKGRSVYATGPTDSVLNSKSTVTKGIYGEQIGLFGEDQFYATGNANGILPFYNAPGRPWGFDVGLLTQAPDLFAQRFAIQDDTPPNEFYREVRRDDQWVENLLCAGQPDKRLDPANSNNTVAQQGGYDDAGDPYDKDVKIANNASVSYQYAISKDQRPSTCQ